MAACRTKEWNGGFGRAQASRAEVRFDDSAEVESSRMDMRKRSQAVWIRFWIVDEKDYFLAHPGEIGCDAGSDGCRAAVSFHGYDTTQTATSRLRTRSDRHREMEKRRIPASAY